jgi:hypothetical protein
MRIALSCGLLLALTLSIGCNRARTVTIIPKPGDATIKIDRVERGRGQVTETFLFRSPSEVHVVEASRVGYKTSVVQLTRDDPTRLIEINLKPQTRDIHLAVEPVPAVIKINDREVTNGPVSVHTEKALPFTVDERNHWTSYSVTAEREGFRPAQVNVTWTDNTASYTLRLEPMRKELNVKSTPSGAKVYLDGDYIGDTPLVGAEQPFPYNVDAKQFDTRTLRLERAGYDPAELQISWDEGKTDYDVNLAVKQKVVRIMTDPPEAKVEIEGAKPERSGDGINVYTLEFPPDDQGKLKTYEGNARMPAGEREWEPASFTIAYDEGRSDYQVSLKEILTRPVPLTAATMRRTDAGAWECVPQEIQTLSMKDRTEPPGRSQAVPIARPGAGKSIGSMAIAPSGNRILFTQLTGKDRASFRSQMFLVHTDGTNSIDTLTDGHTLDIHPSFTPGGDQILFSSNRAGPRMQIWAMPTTGDPGVTRMITSESNDLWPTIDADPKPRLFYQAMVDTRPDPRIFTTPLGSVFQTELSTLPGTQPRVSPRNDAVLFCVVNPETRKRDVYRMSDRGAQPQNLTNTPDVDECDPVWSRDGRMVAFASDRGLDAQGQRNFDIWVLDLAKPREPMQVTVNGSHDDSPLFDPRGGGIYFRSNRGGEWGIWRVSVK